MLEVLLRQYEQDFGEPFPLADFEGHTEIEVINIVYECCFTGQPYYQGMTVKENRFPDAPKS